MVTNCPNCNGIVSRDGGLHCEYCGAWLEEPEHSVIVKVHSPAVDDNMMRTVALGLLTPNEARRLISGLPAMMEPEKAMQESR